MLQFLQLVFCLTHHMCDALGILDVRRTIRYNDVFSGDKRSNLATLTWVVVHLLERTAREWQRPQHLLVLRAILSHHLGQLVVHVLAHAGCGFFAEDVDRANNLGFHRPHRWERLHHGL